MTRYVSIRGDWYDDERFLSTHTVIEEEREPRKTGILDQYGVMIYAVPDERPVGFGIPQESRPKASPPGRRARKKRR